MTYPELNLTPITGRPVFYSNFVQTIDGKVQVLENTKEYWPLGSPTDYQALLELRAHADVLIHGKRTAADHPTLQTLNRQDVQEMRADLGKAKPILYVVVTSNPDATLIPAFSYENKSVNLCIATTDTAVIPDGLPVNTRVLRLGEKEVSLEKLAAALHNEGHKQCLVEGGPNLMASFMKEDLLDEVFVTIVPKLIGATEGTTLTMIEGWLAEPTKVPLFSLRSTIQINDELYLHYKKSA